VNDLDITKDILERAKNGDMIDFDDENYGEIDAVVEENAELTSLFNNSYHNPYERRTLLSQIFGYEVAETTIVNAPFNTDFGRHTQLGERVFINKDCMFVDLGGITIEDDVLIGPRTTLISVNHVEKPAERRNLMTNAVHIKQHAWLGANVTVLPGVTVGENAIVGAGSVVTKNVADNTIVVGNPAKKIRMVNR
jgi:acetyltransferase-like isoleucine patch superfamily enzyme